MDPSADVKRIEEQIVNFLRQAKGGFLTEDTLRFLVVQAEEMELAAAMKALILDGKVEARLKPEVVGADVVSTADFLLGPHEGGDE